MKKTMAGLIDLLVASPIMAFFDFGKPFVLHTYAFQSGLVAMIYQKQDNGRLAVVAYASELLTRQNNDTISIVEILNS